MVLLSIDSQSEIIANTTGYGNGKSHFVCVSSEIMGLAVTNLSCNYRKFIHAMGLINIIIP